MRPFKRETRPDLMINRPDRFTALVLKIFQISCATKWERERERAAGGGASLIYAALALELSLELLCPARRVH